MKNVTTTKKKIEKVLKKWLKESKTKTNKTYKISYDKNYAKRNAKLFFNYLKELE